MSVTDEDREKARAAIVESWAACERANSPKFTPDGPCDCDLDTVDGCKAKVEAIAKAIAAARDRHT